MTGGSALAVAVPNLCSLFLSPVPLRSRDHACNGRSARVVVLAVVPGALYAWALEREAGRWGTGAYAGVCAKRKAGPVLTPTEHEVMGLKAVVETLDEMLNHAIFRLFEGDNAHLLFERRAQQQLFHAFLLDFLSKPASELVGSKGTHLDVLRRVIERGALSPSADTTELVSAIDVFEAWLNGRFSVDIHIPSTNDIQRVEIDRRRMVWLAGNMAKHRFARLSRVTEKIQQIIEQAGVRPTRGDLHAAVDDLRDRFSEDLLLYHANALAEMLNNIRWAVHNYLLPIYRWAYRQDEPALYQFEYPAGVVDEFARSVFWDLMNDVRRGPYLPRFTIPDSYKVPDYLKGQY